MEPKKGRSIIQTLVHGSQKALIRLYTLPGKEMVPLLNKCLEPNWAFIVNRGIHTNMQFKPNTNPSLFAFMGVIDVLAPNYILNKFCS